jgi:ketosteroid isomerase-like protein
MTPTRTLIETYMNAIRAGDVPALKASFTPDATWWLPGDLPVSRTWHGPDAIFDEFLPAVMARFRPGSLKLTTNSITVAGDTAVLEWTVAATRLDGNPYKNDYMAIFETRDGRISAVREYMDTTVMAPLFEGAAAPHAA